MGISKILNDGAETMSENKETKKESTIEKIKRLAGNEHSDIRFITDGTIEGSKNAVEYAVATDTGLFFYLFKKDGLQPLAHVLWKDVKEIKVDFLAIRTNLTLNGQNYRLVNEGKKIFKLAEEKSEAKVQKVDRKWHQKILGFRSGTTWKKVTAVIAYLFLFGFIGSFFTGGEEVETQVAAEDTPAEESDSKVTNKEEDQVTEENKAKEAAEAKEQEELAYIEEVIAEEEKKKVAEEVEKESKEEKVDWQSEVTTIADTDQSETEKHDAVMAIASDYEASEEEIKIFEEQIVKDFNDGTYLADIENHEYMLTNIFKARMINRFYLDKEPNAIDSFAFDFLQNTKYTYRKVDAVDSETVHINEEQMKDSLSELE